MRFQVRRLTLSPFRGHLIAVGVVAGLLLGTIGMVAADPAPAAEPVAAVLHVAEPLVEPGAADVLFADFFCDSTERSACRVRTASVHVETAEGPLVLTGELEEGRFRFDVSGTATWSGYTYWIELVTEDGERHVYPRNGEANPIVVSPLADFSIVELPTVRWSERAAPAEVLLSLSIVVAVAIYFHQFALRNRWSDLVEVNIHNLAAAPSILFGILILNLVGLMVVRHEYYSQRALKNRQVDGFATAGSWPAPNVQEAAASTEIRLLSLSADQLAKVKGAKLVIPAGTYKGQAEDMPSVGLWSLILARPDLDDETAYRLVRAMHLGHDDFAARLPQGRYTRAANSVRFVPAERLHPGAARYFREVGLLPAPGTG